MFLSNKEISKRFLGNKEVAKVYLGSKHIFPKYSDKLQAIINSATTNNIALPSDLSKIDTFISDLGNVWNKLDILYLLASTDASRDVNFNRIDFIKPTRLGTYNGGLSYSLGGIKGNGTNAYFGTSFNPATDAINYTLNNACRGVFVSEQSTMSSLDGIMSGNSNMMLNLRVQLQFINQANTGGQNNPIDFRGTGLKILNRISATECNGISNGIVTNTTSNSTEIFNSEQLVLRRSNVYGDASVGLYFIGASLTLEEYNIINNAYNNYIA